MQAGFIKSWCFRFTALLLMAMLASCGEVPKRWDPNGYSVKKGDTLYSIAWRYEKDFRQIAEWNNIQSPYAIYPGQRLVMQGVSKDGTLTAEERPQVLVESKTGKVVTDSAVLVEQVKPVRQKPTEIKVSKDDTLYSIARREGYSHHQLARWNRLKSPYLLKPGQSLRLRPPASSLGQINTTNPGTQPSVSPLANHVIKSVPLKAAVKPAKKPVSRNVSLPTRVDKWRWPVKGRVVKTYKAGDTSRKGIGIRGKKDASVKAAAGGTVVYSGNGLINYGNLIIIKHSHSFLSAYAYNNSLLVKEGDSVKPGQAIAKMGVIDSGKAQLHFEIRRNGKPVNPLNYLPKT